MNGLSFGYTPELTVEINLFWYVILLVNISICHT